jgi:beta-catenin-like protein 1
VLTRQQILDIFDKAGDESGEGALSIPALRRQLGKFERAAAKNAEQRGKFPDDPSKYVLNSSPCYMRRRTWNETRSR